MDGEATPATERTVVSERIAHILDRLPASPGVYLMQDAQGTILYVGKAASLRARVRHYFQPGAKPHTPMIAVLLRHVADVEVMHTATDVDALILENNLIKQHQPRYNIKLKDDKRYPFIRITTQDAFPAISVTRQVERDGGRYFGPYVHARATRQTLKHLTRIFPIRTCALELRPSGNQERVCLDYHIGRCPGPCADLISQEDYAEIVRNVQLFLAGRTEHLLQGLRRRMEEASDELDFETAARLRDQIRDIERGADLQRLDAPGGDDFDAVGCAVLDTLACAQVLMVRGGSLIEREHFFLTEVEGERPAAVLSAFVPQYYAEASFVPPVISLQEGVEMMDAVRTWLEQKRGGRVSLHVPVRGRRREMVELAARNAATILEQRAANVLLAADEHPALRELMEMLNLDRLPRRIEAYDISNFGGDIIVGSMVVFEDGRPARSQYRRFRVRDIEGPNDYAAMHQVIYRRFTKGFEEETPMPDVVVVDGGKGQLSAASEALAATEFPHQPRFGIAKRYEHLFLPGEQEPLVLRKDHPTLHLIQQVRNEAHRFASNYLRALRDRRMTHSVLDEIPYVGERRKQALLRHFGDVETVRRASLDDLLAVKNITRPIAQRIYKHLHARGDAPER